MPYDHLEDVKAQVAKLCEDLGMLRLPASTSQKAPYPGSGDGEPGFGLNLAAIVHGLEQSIAEGKAFQLAGKNDGGNGALSKDHLPAGWRSLSPRPSWRWLCGKAVDIKAKPYAFKNDQVHPGVVDARVGDAIAGMLEDDLRHPGAVLIEIQDRMGSKGAGHLWARPELVFSIEMLRVLLTRFGVPYGASMTHTYRPIQAKGGTGRAECSNHKLGLAVDFAICSAAGGKADIQDHGHPPEHFPVRYQAVYGDPELPPKDRLQKQLAEASAARVQAAQAAEMAKADLSAATAELMRLRGPDALVQRKKIAELTKQQKSAETNLKKAEKKEDETAAQLRRKDAIGDSKADQTLSWVICAHSFWDIFAADKPEDIAAELAKRLGKPETEGEAWDAENEYENLLRSGFPGPLTGYADALVKTFVGKMRAVCETLCAMEPLDFRQQLFRKTVRQFQYNPFERDGGDEGPEIAADSDDAWRSDMLDARLRTQAFHYFEGNHHRTHSFVNFSRLANECDLWGITAQRGNPSTKGSFRNPMTDPEIPDKPPARVTYDVNKQTFPPIAALLDDLKKAGDQAPDDQIDLAYPDGTKVSLRASELDIDFIIKWAEEMGKTQADRIEKESASADKEESAHGPPPPPAIGWEGSDAIILLHPQTRDEVEAFLEAFAPKPFLVAETGSKITGAFSTGGVERASSLKSDFTKYVDGLKKPGNQSKDKDSSTKKFHSDYVVRLRPIIQEDRKLALAVGVVVTLPARGLPAPLEWWHHEQGLRASDTYGKNAEDLGFGQDLLLAGTAPPSTCTAPETGGFGYPKSKLERKRMLRKVRTSVDTEGNSGEDGSDE